MEFFIVTAIASLFCACVVGFVFRISGMKEKDVEQFDKWRKIANILMIIIFTSGCVVCLVYGITFGSSQNGK